MTHIAEGVIFALVFLLLVVFKCLDARWNIVIPLALSPIFAIMIDLLTPSMVFTDNILSLTFARSNALIGTAILFVTAGIIFSFYERKIKTPVSDEHLNKKNTHLTKFLYLIPVLYFICVLFYFLNFESIDALAPGRMEYSGVREVPFYAEPVRWGAIGIVVVVFFLLSYRGMISDVSQRSMIVMLAFGLIAVQILNIFYQIYPSYRMDLFAFAGALPLASLFLISIEKRRKLAYLILSLVVWIGAYSFIYHSIFIDLNP
jgi:hypothetical protein